MLNTKKDFEECLKKIINPVKNYYTEGFAGIKCGHTSACYSEQIATMEGFARILWGLAPFWCGNDEDGEFQKIYLEGIINGTNPQHEEYWGILGDYDQRLVETAALGLTLILAPDKIWTPLSETEKTNFYKWLSQVNYIKPADNNWHFFSLLVNLGFKTVGMPYDYEKMEYSLSRVESFYKGNGWYSDGDTNQMDYYISFAIHFYSLIYARIMERDDVKRSELFKKRAMEFAKDFIYWFDEDGSALAFGRSLTYRMAQCCFWSACIFAEIEPFSLGVMKGIISRNIDWWLEKPIFDNGGILSIGYAYPDLCMSEGYNAFGSPYWSLKAFLILALDDEHPFFVAEPLPLPQLNDIHVIKEAKMVIHRINGYVTAITAGQWPHWDLTHVAEKYSKFIYSSRYAFSVPRSYYGLENAGTDNMLVFVKDNMCYVRRECIESTINDDGSVYSKWSPLDNVVVRTLVTPTKTGHIRKHTVTCDKEYTAYDCSFAKPDELDEVTGVGEKKIIYSTPNSNIMNPTTKLTAQKYTFSPGENQVVTEFIYNNT